MKKTSSTPPEGGTTNEEEQPRALYKVLVKAVKVGGVIGYRGARLSLTKDQVLALNTAQPGTVEFAGI